jgi:hypothetical protein
VLLASIQIIFNVDSILTGFQKRKSTIEDIRVKNLGDNSIQQPQNFVNIVFVSLAVVAVDQKAFIVDFEYHLNFNPDGKYKHRHHKVSV